jgi:hypothetical protein
LEAEAFLCIPSPDERGQKFSADCCCLALCSSSGKSQWYLPPDSPISPPLIVLEENKEILILLQVWGLLCSAMGISS